MVKASIGDVIIKHVADNKVVLQDLLDNLPPPRDASDIDSIAAWSRYASLSGDLFGDVSTVAKFVTENTLLYEKGKRNIATRFFVTLHKNPAFTSLCELVDESEGPSSKVLRFIKLIRGVQTTEKKVVLNAAVIVFLTNHVKAGFDVGDPNGVYQPNTTDTNGHYVESSLPFFQAVFHLLRAI
jgi:hypothetical protein